MNEGEKHDKDRKNKFINKKITKRKNKYDERI